MKLESNEPTGDIANRWDKHRFDMKLVNPANKRKLSVIVVGSGLAGASASATPSRGVDLRKLALRCLITFYILLRTFEILEIILGRGWNGKCVRPMT